MKNGVPFDVALSLDEAEAMAFTVVFGAFDGGEFDWTSLRWKDKTP